MEISDYIKLVAIEINSNPALDTSELDLNTELSEQNFEIFSQLIHLLYESGGTSELMDDSLAFSLFTDRCTLLECDISILESQFNHTLYKRMAAEFIGFEYDVMDLKIRRNRETLKSQPNPPIFSGGTNALNIIRSGLQNEFIQFYCLAKVITKTQVLDYSGSKLETPLSKEAYTDLVMNTVLHLSSSHMAKLRHYMHLSFSRSKQGSYDFNTGILSDSLMIVIDQNQKPNIYVKNQALVESPIQVGRSTIKCPIHKVEVESAEGKRVSGVILESKRFRPLVEKIIEYSILDATR